MPKGGSHDVRRKQRDIKRSESIKPPQSLVGAIFLLSGNRTPTDANANVRGSNAAFDEGGDDER
jgi:hypothetical protein